MVLDEFDRQMLLRKIRDLAIKLAIELDDSTIIEASKICSLRVPESYRDPWWVQKARELWNLAKLERNPGYFAKAKSMLIRYGIPEPYHLLATAIVLKRCDLDV